MIKITDYLSPRLLGRDALDKYKGSIKQLAEDSESVAPDGAIVSFLFAKEDKFGRFEKAIANFSLLKRFYNDRTFMHSPELANEFAEIMSHINAANNIIAARKKKLQKQRRKKEPQESTERK